MSKRNTREHLSSTEKSPSPKKVNMSTNAVPDEPEPTLSMIYKLLFETRESIKAVTTEVASLKKMQGDQASILKNLSQENSALKVENNVLHEEIKALRVRVEKTEEIQDDLNQYQRKHNLEVHGIPEKDGEDLETIIEALARELEIEDIEYNDIDIVHRLPSKRSPKPIIVKFKSYDDKKRLYESRFKLRKWSNTEEEKLNGANKVYINENLTPTRRQLFNTVRQRARQNGWYNVFTIDGKIFLKKVKGQRSARITSEADLEFHYF